MKRLVFGSALILLSFGAQAMEMVGNIPVYFKFYTPRTPALHNKVKVVYIPEEKGLYNALKQVTEVEDINTDFALFFDGRRLSHMNNPAIERINGKVFMQDFPDEDIRIDNPISITEQY